MRSRTIRKFLPWCGATTRASIAIETTTRATIEINYHGIRQSFTTENAKRPPQEMLIRLVEGPFRRLEGELALHRARRSRLQDRIPAELRIFRHGCSRSSSARCSTTSPTRWSRRS